MADQQPESPDLMASTTTDLQRRQVSCERLKQDIETLIEPYRTDEDTKPPFSASELVIFALLRAPDPVKGSTPPEILAQILRDFPYYSKQATAQYIMTTIRSDGSCPSGDYWGTHKAPKMVIDRLAEAISNYDLPVTSTERNYAMTFVIEPQEARIYLNQRLTTPRQGHFRFMDLPPELRNHIYEYAFTLSGPEGMAAYRSYVGLFRDGKLALWSSTRANGSLWSPPVGEEARVATHVRRFRLPSFRKMVAITRVCKQVFRESMPMFSSLNSVSIQDFSDLADFTSHMPAQIIHSLVRQVNITWTSEPDSSMSRVFALLAESKVLETFAMALNDEQWLNMRPRLRQQFGRKTKFTSFKQIPCLLDLARIASNVKNFSLTGDCPQLQEYIQSHAARFKAEKQASVEQEAEVKIKVEDIAETDVKGEKSVSKKARKKRPTKKQTTTEQAMTTGSAKRKVKIKKEEVDDQKVVKRRSQRLAGRMN